MATIDAPLGSTSVEQFMVRHWQREPLLVRQAFRGFTAPVLRDALFTLAGRDDVESRLLTAFSGRWQLRHGPFEVDELPATRRKRWTLLVQGVDLHVDAIHALLHRFRFLSDARLDDLMISYATDGGGVGPHLDSYDVFLIQAHGRRRWRIGPPPVGSAADLVAGLPVKILRQFEPTQEWLLEPGDMLYLPPLWAHDGVAEGECMTYSVGFRAPSRLEFLSAFLAECADAPGGDDPRFGDAGIRSTRHPGRLPAALHRTLRQWARTWRPDESAIDRYIGRYLTEPKNNVWFDAPARSVGLDTFVRRACAQGLRADRRTRMSYRGQDFFINGEVSAFASHRLLDRMADARSLTPTECGELRRAPEVAAQLHQWWLAGWILLSPAEPGNVVQSRSI
jgi:50S ribosomal protein L16 3-hydroxylase